MSAYSAWGPFMAGIGPAERRARLRGLRVAVHVWCGPRGRDVEAALRQAEQDEAALARAADAFERLATLDRRRVLATYGHPVSAPANQARRREEPVGLALKALADRVGRLGPNHRDPERFHVEKDEIRAELRRLAQRVS